MSDGRGHPVELISTWIDGETTPEERCRVEEHFRVCASCRGLRDDLLQLAAATRREEVPAVPAGLSDRILRRLDSPAAEGPRPPAPWSAWARRGRGPLAAAAMLVVAVVLWFALQDRVGMPPDAGTPAGDPRLAEEQKQITPPTGEAAGRKEEDLAALAGEPAVPLRDGAGAAPADDAAPPRRGAPSVARGEEATEAAASAPEVALSPRSVLRAPAAAEPSARPEAPGKIRSAVPAPPGLRSLLLHEAGASLSLAEDGSLSVQAGSYACRLGAGDLGGDDAGGREMTRGDRPAAPPEVSALFLDLAPEGGGARPVAATIQAPGEAGSGLWLILPDGTMTAPLLAPGSEAAAAGAAISPLRERVLRIVRERYGDAMARRCGEPPVSVLR